MSRRAPTGVDPSRESASSPDDAPAPPRRPNLSGDLDMILGPAPSFRAAVHGYDRLQVDNYVYWAEAELLAVRREVDDLMARHEWCAAELEAARRLLAHSAESRDVTRISDRIATMLQLAADEAADRTEQAGAECERILGAARADRAEAGALLQAAAEERERRDAEADRERARRDAEAEQLRARAAAESAERIRRAEEAAREERQARAEAAAAELAAVQREVGDLGARREEAHDALERMSRLVAEALQVLDQTLRGAPAAVPAQWTGVAERGARAAS